MDRRKRLSNVRLYTGIGGVLLPIGEWNATRGRLGSTRPSSTAGSGISASGFARSASPDTNKFRCKGCGRHFNSEEELKEHQRGCLAAKSEGSGGRKTGQGKLEDGEIGTG